ncbi:hypothetical protein RB213_011087 [Colletotrichum asianum]
MFTESASLVWWKLDVSFHPCRLFSQNSIAVNEKIAADYFPVFCDSLRAMPGLSTFVSEPMHPDRPLQDAVDGYPFVAQLFQSYEESIVDTHLSGINRFLQKAIFASRQWSGGPSIDELHLVHIDFHTASWGMDGFRLLKRLHFCCINRDPDGMLHLSQILGASQSLSSLRLCFDIVGQEIPPFPSERVPSPEGLSILDKGTQKVDDDIYLDSDGSYEPENDNLDELESITEDDITAGQPVMPWEDDERPMYAREHMSHLRHLEQFKAGGGEGPAMWHFKKRNGEEAWGEDPLEFWPDWEGSEAGDVPINPGI